MNKKVIEAAKKKVEEEIFNKEVDRYADILRRPWYIRMFPYRFKIKVINLNKGE